MPLPFEFATGNLQDSVYPLLSAGALARAVDALQAREGRQILRRRAQSTVYSKPHLRSDGSSGYGRDAVRCSTGKIFQRIPTVEGKILRPFRT